VKENVGMSEGRETDESSIGRTDAVTAFSWGALCFMCDDGSRRTTPSATDNGIDEQRGHVSQWQWGSYTSL
jgi:hypothetical protein